MAEGRLEAQLFTIEGLRQQLDEARQPMPVLEPRTPHKKRRTIRPTPVAPVTPAPTPLPVSEEDCPICGEETEEEGSVHNPIKL
jgi:hypothetical protein